ncbi:hypothetical protein BSNK01_08300 [Bacillaceae bacterium]
MIMKTALDYFPRVPRFREKSSGNIQVNPRLTTAEDVQRIIENAYYGRLDVDELR